MIAYRIDYVDNSPQDAPSATPGQEVTADVRRVIDGDTILVDQQGVERRVRLLGIDTPESVKPGAPVECFGPEAAARTTELLTGQTVRLEPDPTQDQTDVYGRTLAYVWLDDVLVNDVLVAEGFAREYTYEVLGIHHDILAESQRHARDEGLGLWSSATCAGGR
ncbi:thermonuclease family protein [Cellulomonas sp. HD19AZ1]|uniref:thermonuclease family protein n=1 Tax=Cellulomonas sp. HD19AZ1 TaxID=2559593 RepID=UPI001430DFEF|nr:thermonuclease family protein [Cellulomonas sp. HD19AZ1]